MDARKIMDFGIGTYIRNLLDWFPRLHSGIGFHLIFNPASRDRSPLARDFLNSRRPPAFSDYSKKFAVHTSDSGKYSFKEHWDIPKILRRVRADLYHSPHYVTPILKNTPTVVTIHDLIHLIFPQYLTSKGAHAYARLMFANTVKRSERIITDSEWSKRDLIRWLNVPEKKIRVTHLAADERFGKKPEREWRPVLENQIGISDSYVLFVGNFKPHKNVDSLIRAFQPVPDSLCRHLVLAGKGWQESPDLQQRVAECGLTDRVLVREGLSFDQLNALYNGASLFVLPSYYEGFGLPPLEAMASGVPVAVSNTASLPEICGDAALYFRPDRTDEMTDIILEVLKNSQLKKSCIQRGAEWVKRYSWKKTAEKTLNIYRELG